MSADIQATFCAALVDEWIRGGVQHAVIAPGSRSTPMALALTERTELSVHVCHDERSAGFMALGIGLASARPALALCTSGTAATHFHAAVVEADLSGVPMLALTADRPPELQGVGAPQTIDQANLYGAAVRRFVAAPVPAESDRSQWRPLAAAALRHSMGPNAGPVQVNLPFREPLVGACGELPAPIDDNPVVPDDAAGIDLVELVGRLDRVRGLIVAGRGAGDPAVLGHFAGTVGWPILADPRSGARHLTNSVSAFDALLRHAAFADDHRPDVVLHLGESPASKVLGEWLLSSDAHHVHVHRQPRTIDPLGIIDHRVIGSPAAVLASITGKLRGGSGTPWLARWLRAEAVAQRAIDSALAGDVLSEPQVARVVSQLARGPLVVSSSMPIRDVEWYGAAGLGPVYSNRGANGIDGVVATAIGVATASAAPTTLLIGDVALLHDSPSLVGAARRAIDLTIVVVDNDGGAIFSFLPQAELLEASRFEQLFGTPHGVDLLTLASAHGITACSVASTEELALALQRPGVSMVRVASDRTANVVTHRAVNEAVRRALTAG